VKLLELLLDFMTARPETFDLWFNLFKTHYLPAFYPEVCNQAGVCNHTDGFKPCCPFQIQAVIIARVESWFKNERIIEVLFNDPQNSQIMLEVYKQSCQLPISSDASIKKSISAFRALFFADTLNPVLVSRKTEFQQIFLKRLSVVFFTDSQGPLLNTHVSLCLEILQLFKYMFAEAFEQFEEQTQEVLLYTLLEITTTLLKEDSPNKGLAENLCAVIMDTILFLWIRTKTSKEHLWKALQDGVSRLFHISEPVVQVKIKVIQLTLVIRDLIYPSGEKKKKKVVQRRSTSQQDVSTLVEKAEKTIHVPRSPDFEPPPPDVKRDTAITNMSWTVQEIKYIWNQMLQIFQKVNQISRPAIHAEAISCLTEVVMLLMRAEEKVPAELQNLSEQINIVETFGVWLFEACMLPGDAFLNGKADAYGTVCRLICRWHLYTFPQKLLSHFYALVQEGLTNHSNSIVSYEILKHSSNVFNLALPGVNVLIPYYMREISRILSSDNIAASTSVNKAEAKHVRMKSITLLCSLICYSNHLSGLELTTDGPEKTFSMTSLRTKIANLLMDTVQNDPIPEHKVMCIWGSCVVLFEELTTTCEASRVNGILNHLLGVTVHADRTVAQAALDALSALTSMQVTLSKVSPQAIAKIIETFCRNICQKINEGVVNKTLSQYENTVAETFYALLEWLMAAPEMHIMDDMALASKVSIAIETGLLGQNPNTGNAAALIQTERDKEATQKVKDKKRARYSIREPMQSAEPEEVLRDLVAQLCVSPSHGSDTVRKAAHCVLTHLLSHFQAFPSKEGVEVMHSQVNENDDMFVSPEGVYNTYTYVYNDSSLMTLCEVPDGHGSHFARLLLRDVSGKYAWDCSICDDKASAFEDATCSLIINSDDLHANFFEHSVVKSTPRQSNRPSEQTPTATPNLDRTNVDLVDDLLVYLSENWKDCLAEGGSPLNCPDLSAEYLKDFSQVESTLLSQDKEELAFIHHRQENRPPSESWCAKPPEMPIPASMYHHCRLLLSHLGLLSFDMRERFCMVDNSQRLQRSLGQLDKTSGREMFKIGIIYVKPGQENQSVVLKNEMSDRSPLFNEFVHGLGWTVDISTHRGYLGGLDPKLTTGTTAPYFANSLNELIFHDITSMPTVQNDDQQIHKKRHVGNDVVHIVWSEHTRDYNPETITSQFNDAHIVIYPCSNGLFRIQVFRKETVPLFGPLLHGMAVSKALLPVLTRIASMNANRYVRFITEGYTRPYEARSNLIEELVKRYKLQKTYEEFINNVVLHKPEKASSSTANLAASVSTPKLAHQESKDKTG